MHGVRSKTSLLKKPGRATARAVYSSWPGPAACVHPPMILGAARSEGATASGPALTSRQASAAAGTHRPDRGWAHASVVPSRAARKAPVEHILHQRVGKLWCELVPETRACGGGTVMLPRVLLSLVLSLLMVGTAASEALESRLDTIKKSGTVRISFRPDANPFSFQDERGEQTGYTVEICKLVVKSMQEQLAVPLTITWVPVDTTTRFDTVVKDLADMECGSSTVTLSRMAEVDFSSFVFVESTGLAVRADSGIRGLNDLAGKKIAVLVGTTNERALRDQLSQRRLESTLVLVTSRAEGVARLEDGSVDGFASDKLLLVGALLEKRPGLTVLPEDFSFEPYAITLPRGDWALRLAVNRALAEIYRSGAICGSSIDGSVTWRCGRPCCWARRTCLAKYRTDFDQISLAGQPLGPAHRQPKLPPGAVGRVSVFDLMDLDNPATGIVKEDLVPASHGPNAVIRKMDPMRSQPRFNRLDIVGAKSDVAVGRYRIDDLPGTET